MRVVFFGTPEWAVPSLDALLTSGADIPFVVTNPDRPVGRKAELRAPPVKKFASEREVEVFQPASARDPSLQDKIASSHPDVAVVVAYGKILPGGLLASIPKGFVNVHFSLLPAYRGAAPVQRALIAGETRTGVSTMVLTEGMDEGPVLARRAVDVDPDETAGELGVRLAVVGAEILVESLNPYVSGELTPVAQDDAAASYAPKLSADETRIRWGVPARAVHDLVRGANPEPGAWTTYAGDRVKVLRTRPVRGDAAPGEITFDGGRLVAGCGDGAVEILQAQRAGARAMTGAEFARGLRPAGGDRFE